MAVVTQQPNGHVNGRAGQSRLIRVRSVPAPSPVNAPAVVPVQCRGVWSPQQTTPRRSARSVGPVAIPYTVINSVQTSAGAPIIPPTPSPVTMAPTTYGGCSPLASFAPFSQATLPAPTGSVTVGFHVPSTVDGASSPARPGGPFLHGCRVAPASVRTGARMADPWACPIDVPSDDVPSMPPASRSSVCTHLLPNRVSYPGGRVTMRISHSSGRLIRENAEGELETPNGVGPTPQVRGAVSNLPSGCSLNGGADVLSLDRMADFMEAEYSTASSLTEAVLAAVASSCSMVTAVRYYSAKRRGNEIDFFLATSSVKGETPDTAPTEDLTSLIRSAAGVAPRIGMKVMASESIDHHVAAAVRDIEGDVAGVLILAGTNVAGAKPHLNSMARCWASLLSRRLQQIHLKETLKTQKQREELYDLAGTLAGVENTQQIVDVVQEKVADLMSCEAATVFFIDETSDEIWAPPKRLLPKGLVLPSTLGVVGHVARAARQTKDFDQSLIWSNDPRSVPSWAGDPDPGFVTRNFITGPIFSQSGKRLLGLLQILNRRPRGDEDEGFSDKDEAIVKELASFVAVQLERLMLDTIMTKATMTASSLFAVLKEEYYQSATPTAKLIHDSAPRCSMSIHLDNLQTDGVPADSHLFNWRVDYWALTEHEEFLMLSHALTAVNTFSSLALERKSLYRYFSKVRAGYNDNPYHNFKHAVATVHYAFKLMERAEVSECMEQGDLFALIVGALCHDLGHRGYTQQFEVQTRSELALRYNDISPLENFHCARAFEIAFEGGAEGEANIFAGFSEETYKIVRQRMIAGILATDMNHHGDCVKKVGTYELKPGVDGAQNQFLVELFMHTADIANVFMPPDISARWSSCLAEEFTAQVASERQAGIPVTAFMDGLTTPLGRAKSSIGFIDFVVTPLVTPLFRLFPKWTEPQAWLAENRQRATEIVAASDNQAMAAG